MKLCRVGVTAAYAALVIFVSAAAAADQKPGGLGGILDALSGVIGGSQRLSGHIVLVEEAALVLRTADGQSMRVDLSPIDPRVRTSLQPGESVTIVAKPGSPSGAVVASEIHFGSTPRGEAAAKMFNRIEGTVIESGRARVVFRSREGLTLPLDTSRLRGLEELPPDQPAILIYEQGPRHEILPVWIARAGTSAGSAMPAASIPGGPGERLEGVVEAVSASNLTLQRSDGRRIAVELDRIDAATRQAIRAGDVVTVVGRSTQRDTFAAEWVQKQQPDRR